jgi:hypothetical protein
MKQHEDSTMRMAGLLVLVAVQSLGAQEVSLQATIARVVNAAADAAEQNYVFPDTGRLVADHLRKRLKEGGYRSVTELAQLGDRLTVDMQAINRDRHLYVTYTGRSGDVAAAGPRPQVMMRRPGDPVAPEVLVAARRANYDVHSVQRLAGNVGYVSLGMLSSRGSDEAFAVIDAAMAFLEHVDAMIIDLRRTPGGDPRMVDYVASYFFGAEPVTLLSSYSRRLDRTIEHTTGPVRGKRRPVTPVFVLVGQGTASGAEALSFIFKQSGRGILVGARTAGAGRLTSITPIGDGFSVSVSAGRAFDPRTGAEWERVGIAPDIAATDAEALTTAHAAALEKVAATTADSAWRRTLGWTRQVVLARARPFPIEAKLLRAIAGEYDVRLVRYEDGRLWYQRDASRPREELIPVGAETFALGEATRVDFVRDGDRVTAMRMTNPLGQVSNFPRTK